MKERTKVNRLCSNVYHTYCGAPTNVGRGFHGCHDMNQVNDKLNYWAFKLLRNVAVNLGLCLKEFGSAK